MLIILVTGVNNTSNVSQGNNCTLNVSQGNNCTLMFLSVITVSYLPVKPYIKGIKCTV